MIRAYVFVFGCLVAFAVCGCQQPNKVLMDSLNKSWALIEPYAVAGVEADEELDEISRENRMKLIVDFGRTLAEGKTHAE